MDDERAESPLLWICWACRQLECGRCRREEGCEHVLVGRIDGELVLCPALLEEVRWPDGA